MGSIKWEKQGAVVFMGGDDNAKRDQGNGFPGLEVIQSGTSGKTGIEIDLLP